MVASHEAMSLNPRGWKRLWIALSILLFVAAAGFVVYRWSPGDDQIEDLVLIHAQNAKKVTPVEIPGLGIVSFPDTVSQDDIEALINANFEKNRSRILELAYERMVARDRAQAAKARETNSRRRVSNHRLLVNAFAVWLGSVTCLYVFGWATGWVSRGFKFPDAA
jgi:hypothetical protein